MNDIYTGLIPLKFKFKFKSQISKFQHFINIKSKLLLPNFYFFNYKVFIILTIFDFINKFLLNLANN